MCLKDHQRAIQPSEAVAPDSGPDSESTLAGTISLLNLAKFFDFAMEQKRPIPQSFQTLLAETNQELEALLREVRASPDAESRSTGEIKPNGELLMRAVQCAVKQQMLQKELGFLALTDELTGLYNRRGFLCLAERQLMLADRSGREMLLLFIDVNGLKQINDSFGHFEGDVALARAAKALVKTFRGSDILARLGGDEFAALAIEGSGYCEASIIARLNESVEELSAQEHRYRLSLSVGVVPFTQPTTSSIAELMLQADRAMYQAKLKQRISIIRPEENKFLKVPTKTNQPNRRMDGIRHGNLHAFRSLYACEPDAKPIATVSSSDQIQAPQDLSMRRISLVLPRQPGLYE